MANKVYTTIYSDFKGVDYTNDASNVWKRRSPTGYNMLPDESGRPFKRTGWEVLIENEEIKDALTEALGYDVDEVKITKLSWFELAGEDHIVIFTDAGVLFYNGIFTAINTTPECYMGYDRCFFFEGGGTSAFYIYGSARIWKYDDTFTLTEVTSNVTIPTVIVGASADGTGTVMRGYNMLGSKVQIEYCSCDLKLAQWVSDEIGVLLPNDVSDGQVSDVKVWVSTKRQFDKKLTTLASTETLDSDDECKLHGGTSAVTIDGVKYAWIEFNKRWTALVDGEDFIRVQFPTILTQTTNINNKVKSGEANLVGLVGGE